MVLSYGQETTVNKKDELLAEYATLLSRKEQLQLPSQETVVEGWQLALRVLGRLEDAERAQNRVAALLDGLSFSSNAQVDHVLELCNDLGFSQHALGITEVGSSYQYPYHHPLTDDTFLRNMPTQSLIQLIAMVTLYCIIPGHGSSRKRREWSTSL